MTESVQPISQGISRLQVGSMRDSDIVDRNRVNSGPTDNHIQRPVIENNTKKKDDKKLKKKEEENEKRAQRQREKEEKEARKQEEKERKKLKAEQTSKRIVNFQPINKYKARVVMLDDSDEYVDLGKEDTGKILYNRVCDLMRLEEKDYFGLIFYDQDNNRCWLDNEKRVRAQLKGLELVLYFQVKFYPPEPALLQEDITRYQLCLQLRKDILSGKLPCSFVTYALLGSYTAQAELGDYGEDDHGVTSDYLKELQFAPLQDEELLKRIHEQHRRHKGQPPNVADLHFLENAKKLAMYGVDIHPAQDSENVNINIGVSANGILIYRDKLRINRFAWPKILKISYKRKYFFIKLRPSDFDRYESTIGFKLPSYRAAKCLWKIAVEHHAFFRLRRPEEMRKRPMLPRFNSTFRYTGTYTYHQTRQILLDRPNPDFERSLSKRMTRSLDAAGIDAIRTMPRPQSVEPFTQTQRIPIIEHDEDENIITPGYALVKKKPERPPITPPRTPQPPSTTTRETKSKRPAPLADYANLPPEPAARLPATRDQSSIMNPDDALLAAIRLATDLDPNKQAEQIVLPNS